MKFVLYTMMIACFAIAGIMDLVAKEWKFGVIALLLALINGLMFFWR